MIRYYTQTEDVKWIHTPKGTIWVLEEGSYYLQPEDPSLRINLGVNINLIDGEDWIWEKIEIIENKD